MFFIFGVSSTKDKLDFNQKTICPGCGRYGRYEAFVEYTYFSLFFIPILKWNKKYYIRSSCCGSIYSISNSIGDKISGDENVDLKELEELGAIMVQFGKQEEKLEKECPDKIKAFNEKAKKRMATSYEQLNILMFSNFDLGGDFSCDETDEETPAESKEVLTDVPEEEVVE